MFKNRILVFKICGKKPTLFLVMQLTKTVDNSFYFFYKLLTSH